MTKVKTTISPKKDVAANYRPTKSPPKKNYLDKKKFHQALITFKRSAREAKEKGLARPEIPNYIGDCISKIANGLGSYYKYSGYTFREDMIGDAIENAIRAVNNDNYDPEKFDNPHAYFTQIMVHAFWRRIEKEKKQSYIRHKSLQNFYTQGLTVKQPMDDNVYDFAIEMDDEGFDELVEKFERKVEPAKDEPSNEE